jgi:Uma2 family endonuclease
MSRSAAARNPHVPPEPTWDVALLFPEQGTWSEEEYLELKGNRLVELSHGILEVLPMPTDSHQAIVAYLYTALLAFVAPRQLGTLRFAPLRLRLWEGKFREPDLLFLSAAHDAKRRDEYWEGADFVVEVVSSDDRRRDLVTKRREYAKAGIPEYWIIDPGEERVIVLHLAGDRYQVHGEFPRGSRLSSVVFDGIELEIDAILDAR